VKRGYTSVYAFIGGIPEWHQFNYPMTENKKWQEIPVEKFSPTEVSNAVKDRSIYVLDVRPLDFSHENSFIRGSFHCPLVHLADRCTEIPRDRKIIITDWAMKQSPSAGKFLIDKGYQVQGVLKGGIERWKVEGFPVEERAVTSTLSPLGGR
jgi:rhodanese-related sulfurtransferase